MTEIDLPPLPEPPVGLGGMYTPGMMKQYARQAISAEREACAREADYYAAHSSVARSILIRIRARGEKR